MLTKIPAGRFGELVDRVGAAIFLCAEGLRYANGSMLYVDDGLSAPL
jgi:NAD(P)-dependent dehydrogenase (short-subunit alcohol dehydrogenase family)